ncbi:1-acylglycerol-3-phosphate O-acyltransferase [Glaciecola siphonariae]|uniref:1-acyl-sn-glycerol-3-phosphate acyltransferase n=1 Tax=Glaciecola siphonariae TaxID=521012 RepID=A0ABV9LZS6_9ALTE
MLGLLRAIVLFFYFILINAFLIIAFLLRPMHRNNVHLAGNVYSSMAKILGVKLELRVSDKIKSDESYIFIANHQNTWDLLSISKAALPGVVTIGKKSLKWIPIFGLIYWLSGNIMIDRKDSGKARNTLSLAGRKARKRGLSIWMFPEGTRSRGKGILPFKTGAFRLALDTKLKVVPVCCSDNHHSIRFNRWNNGTVVIEVMDPMEIDRELPAKQTALRFENIIKQKFEQLNEEAALLSKA